MRPMLSKSPSMMRLTSEKELVMSKMCSGDVVASVGDHEDVDIRKQVNLDAYSETNLELRRQVMHDHTYRALVRQVYDLLEDKEAGAIKKQTYVPARAK
jgi:hypothetical protein